MKHRPSAGTLVGTTDFTDLVAQTARKIHSNISLTLLESTFAGLQEHAAGNLCDDVALLCVEAI